MAYTLKVYTTFKKGNKEQSYSFTVDTPSQVNDHVRQIFEIGYRRVLDSDTVEWYPPHVISRVEATGPNLDLGYNDTDITE